jgi:serine/threonine protein kinase
MSDATTQAMLPRLVSGQTLQHFRIEGLLGQGGMGAVYRAFDTRLHRPVAVKVLAGELTTDAERKQRFLQEARAAARVSHPAIAPIHYVDEEAGVTFIVMELVEGKTVRELIQNHELDVLSALDIAAQVAEGLAKAHEAGVVHRDIKPANVMLTRDGHAKILDFGLAKLLDRPAGPGPGGTVRVEAATSAQTLPGMVMGTPAYMSPEQVRGAAVDFRCDIFSFGVLLFEMLTGQSPFQRASFVDSLHAVAFDETPPLNTLQPQAPEALQRIVARCLRKQPEERYPSARALAEELRTVRRDTETRPALWSAWQRRLSEFWQQSRHLPVSSYAWFLFWAVALGVTLFLSVSRIGLGGVVLLALAGAFLYRYVRNRPQRIQDGFVRRVARIPEVRLVVFQGRQATVAVDRPAAQLYNRINAELRAWNRKLFAAPPMSVAIAHTLPDDAYQKLLAGPGVQYVREDRAPEA